MVLVSDYLRKLLYQYDCIVVPDLGGFILHSVPATFVASTHTYLPPRKRLAFNEGLKIDDGLLINYMMFNEQLTREEVFQRVRQFVDTLKQDVRHQGSFTVEGIGLFSENEEGRLQFDPELRHNFQGESYGMQAVSVVRQEAPEVLAVEVQPMPVVENGVMLVEAEEVAPVVERALGPKTPARSPYLMWVAAALVVCSFGAVSILTVQQRSPARASSSLSPFELLWTRQENPQPVTRPLQESPAVSAPVPAPEAPVTVPVVTQPTGVQPKGEEPAPVVVAEKPKAQPVVPTATVVATPKNSFEFLAIAGSFASKRNALKLVRQLRKEGFKTAYVLPRMKRNELIKVVAFGTNDRTELLTSLDQVSRLSGSRAWVYHRPE